MGKKMKQGINVPIQGTSYTITWDSTEEPTFIFEYDNNNGPSLYIEYTKDTQGQLSPGMVLPVEGHPSPDLRKYTLLSPQEVAVQRALGALPDEIIDDEGPYSFKVWAHN